MHMNEFSRMNRERSECPTGFGHNLSDWSLSDWFVALVGEIGEAANIVKKLNRIRDGFGHFNRGATADELNKKLADELADAYCYLDLAFSAAGIDKEAAVLKKFNEISAERGYSQPGANFRACGAAPKALKFIYRNHRDEIETRIVDPDKSAISRFEYWAPNRTGLAPLHPDGGWMLSGICRTRKARRTFDVKRIIGGIAEVE